jgi:mono/diheme cytochrome c family protein
MNFPVWEMELGNGMLIALVACLHVFVSHFAIGGGFFLVITEFVFGAITGVGIWFTLGLINPAATSALIHTFVWIWALEWIFFLVEVAAAMVYYNSWNRVSQTLHFSIGWIYLLSSFMSLVLINGILTFMLTPSVWLESRYIWEGFFNVTFLPSLFARTAFCIALAGVYALITGSYLKDKITGNRMKRYAGIWALTGIILALPSLVWYYYSLPLDFNELFAGGLPTSLTSVRILGFAGFTLMALLLIPIIIPKYFHKSMSFVLALLALASFASSEFVRESVRKPYTIYGYMYGNGLLPEEYLVIEQNGGILATANFVANKTAVPTVDAGKDVFRAVCRSCHTLSGYKSIRRSFNGTDTKFISEVIARLERLRGKMPPFPGNAVEREALALYIASETDPDYRISTGEDVFNKRCGKCHTVDGEYRGLYDILDGHDYDSLLERIPTLGSMQKKMVPWSGTNEEAQMLARYIMTWYSENTNTQTGGK